MTSRSRRRGLFEGLPRVLYRRTGARFLDACAAGVVLNGVTVALFGTVALALYLDLTAAELLLVAAAFAAGYVVEGVPAALELRRAARPLRAWLAGERTAAAAREAWSTAARLPVALLRRPGLYALGAAGAAATALAVAAILDLPAGEAVLLFPVTALLYVSSVILRYIALELSMRPLLERIGEPGRDASRLDAVRLSLHRRMIVAVPMVTWGAAVIVAGVLTENTRELDTIGLGGVVSFGVSGAVSIWLSLVLADAVTAPIVDLRDATRRVADGDLDVRVPVVSTDETGELAASFNTMVAGLGERERLRKAFGTFVDPSLTERVLTEGTDLRGEEVEVSVAFVDVRGFTRWAEGVTPQEVVAVLNELYETVVPVIHRHGGHANKFIGDGLLAVFGAPERHADHAARAVAAAREIARTVRARFGERLRVGVGVNTGRVVAGTIGGGGRREFTVIGDPVNTAARVEAATRLTGDDVLVTEDTLRALGPGETGFEERPAAPLKGKSAPVRLFALRDGGSPP